MSATTISGGTVSWTLTKIEGSYGVVCRQKCMIHTWVPRESGACYKKSTYLTLPQVYIANDFIDQTLSVLKCLCKNYMYHSLKNQKQKVKVVDVGLYYYNMLTIAHFDIHRPCLWNQLSVSFRQPHTNQSSRLLRHFLSSAVAWRYTSSNFITHNYCCRACKVTLSFMDTLIHLTYLT